MRCVIVDDSASFRDAARGILERGGIEVVGVASSATDALRCVEELRPDVTLVDVDLGGESGFDVAERVHRAFAGSSVILISTHAEQEFADMVAASPAVGFLSKFVLSPDAVHDLLRSRDKGGATGSVSEPRGR